MKNDKASSSLWQKTQYANLIRYVPSGIYFARMKVRGKLIRKSLKTDAISVAKLRLGDLEKSERQVAENNQLGAKGKVTFGEALIIYRNRMNGDIALKPRTKSYYEERMVALKKSWPNLEKMDLRKLTKTDCLNWAAEYGAESSASAFNHTVSLLKKVVEIGVELGARYDNPTKFIKRAKERPKKLQLPDAAKFSEFVAAIEASGSGFSKPCADLVRFLAFGGFRKNEAAYIVGSDCDFEKGEIVVKGDPQTGTKNGLVRRVPMVPAMRKLLERLKEEKGSDWSSQPVMRVRECQKAMDRAADEVGISRITHHDLRHLFATTCIESGVDIPTVSRWLGHKDGGALAMKVYGHLRDQHSANMAQKVSFSA